MGSGEVEGCGLDLSQLWEIMAWRVYRKKTLLKCSECKLISVSGKENFYPGDTLNIIAALLLWKPSRGVFQRGFFQSLRVCSSIPASCSAEFCHQMAKQRWGTAGSTWRRMHTQGRGHKPSSGVRSARPGAVCRCWVGQICLVGDFPSLGEAEWEGFGARAGSCFRVEAGAV